MRKNISTNTPSERKVGYSRAVIVNNKMYISGTTAIDEQGRTCGKTLYEQADYCFKKIKTVLTKNGFSAADVVLVTAYVISLDDLGGFDQAFREHFFRVKPGCTLVGVKALIKPDLLVEVAAIAEKS